MASGMKIITTHHKQQKTTYFVYSGLHIRMDPSATSLDTKVVGTNSSTSSASSPSVPLSNSAFLPVSIVGFRGMSDDSINELLLEKLKSCSSKPNENIDVLRAASARLHSRAGSQDKDVRENTLARLRRKKSEGLEVLLNLLENVRDHITAASIAGTIRECIAPKSDKKDGRKLKIKMSQTSPEIKKSHHSKGGGRISTIRRLVELNATQSLVKIILLLHAREIQQSDMLMQEILWILGQLSQKDSKFSIRTRLLNGVKIFHYLLRCHYFNHNKMLTPLLLIMKSLARNGTTVQILVKDGITSTLEKTLAALGFSPNSKLRLLLNVFSYLTRHNKFCNRMVKVGLVPQLLKLFERWERYDGKMRLRICYHTLQTLQHLCYTKAGRSAISAGNGLTLLHKFCQNCPDDAQHDPLLTKTCSIINACIERKELPIASASSPASFSLPLNNGIPLSIGKIGSTDTDDSGEESIDDEIEEEEDKLEKDNIASEEPSLFNPYPYQQSPQRDLDELNMYNGFWSEIIVPSSKLNDVQNGLINIVPSKLAVNDNKTSFQSVNFSTAVSLSEKKQDRRCSGSISSKVGNLKVFDDLLPKDSLSVAYCKIASKLKTVLPFVKVAYPDMVDCLKVDSPDPLFIRNRKIYRTKLLSALEKNIFSEHNTMNNIIYDIDQLVAEPQTKKEELSNWDEERIGLLEVSTTSLQFESRFESGNLRRAIQVGPREYDLIMMPDVNSCLHHNWFYFEVSNMDNSLPYTLNIINCDKPNSQFNFGMRPLLYSVKEATLNRPRWVRTGDDICYFKNAYTCPGKSSKKKKSFQTLSFSIKFPHNLDVCYIAYHFPYTYSRLLLNLWTWTQSVLPHQAYVRVENLCNTLNNNETPLLTITAPEDNNSKFVDREVIFLTSRVHPGETNSSWVMHGSLDFLLSNSAVASKLRSKYIIKIVPMLNPEGVINGCYRCGLSNEDLNRKWRDPDPVLHSAIFHTKGMIDYSCRVLKKIPYVFCDYHGHSRRKNVFLFGCSPSHRWNQPDIDKESGFQDYIMLPTVLSSIAPAFDLSQCSFVMEQSKESTARITVWREFGVTRSYTMESSYCGFDVGVYKGNHMNITHLEEMGEIFCLALVYLTDDPSWMKHTTGIESLMSTDNPLSVTTEPRLEDFDETSDSDSSDNDVIKS